MSSWRKMRKVFLLVVWLGLAAGCGGGEDGGGSVGNSGSSVEAAAAGTGFKVYYGTSSGNYGPPVDIGRSTSVTLTLVPGRTYYFSVTAYNAAGESGFSQEVSKFFPPTGTATTTATLSWTPA